MQNHLQRETIRLNSMLLLEFELWKPLILLLYCITEHELIQHIKRSFMRGAVKMDVPQLDD